MALLRHLSPRPGDVLLLVGTSKGAFVLRSGPSRRSWELAGPYFPGRAVYAMAYDDRASRQRLWAAAQSAHFGAVLQWSGDFGRTWTEPENIRFPEGSGRSLRQIWQICLGHPGEPDSLYCGTEPAALFQSKDAGHHWSAVAGLLHHPHQPRWEPGGGGLCLHTILPDPRDPKRTLVAISTGGVYRTDDGGLTWRARNQGIRAPFLPNPHPEFGQCVHKVVQHPARPERLFLQNHWGLYRSDDGGDSWQDVAKGVPSDFGFAMAIHAHAPDTVYIVPIESDEFRCVPEAKLRVYRTRNAGRSWEPLSSGLPQKGAFETILRDGLATDRQDPVGVYFGTRSGKVFASRNEGATWKLVLEGLPPIVCLKTAFVARAGLSRTRRRPPSVKGRTSKTSRNKRMRAKRAARRA
jgi:photosystem II stability/assembly factor-like uncharacterized protein